MSERKWMCLRCLKEHPIIDGVIQCDAPKYKPMIDAEHAEFMRWIREDMPLIDIKHG